MGICLDMSRNGLGSLSWSDGGFNMGFVALIPSSCWLVVYLDVLLGVSSSRAGGGAYD